MMILVDTSVWVDFFSAHPGPQVAALETFLSRDEDLCICGIILTEILQGIRGDRDYERTKSYFDSLVFLPMARDIFIEAADIYRALRRKGMTVRKPVDCMIAAVALEHDVPLLHNDRDFDPMELHCGLKVIHP